MIKLLYRTLSFQFGSYSLPFKGHDAYFASTHCLAVADGFDATQTPPNIIAAIHRMAAYNYRPFKDDLSQHNKYHLTAYVNRLMSLLSQNIKDDKKMPHFLAHPIDLFTSIIHNNTIKGVSTLTMITLEQNILRACYIGDSQFIIIRDNQLVYKSMHHGPNQYDPYFFGNFQRQKVKRKWKKPQEAIQYERQMKAGDVVVVASDGLWNNLPTEYIIDYIISDQHKDLKNLSLQARSNKSQRSTLDDIAIVVGYIK